MLDKLQILLLMRNWKFVMLIRVIFSIGIGLFILFLTWDPYSGSSNKVIYMKIVRKVKDKSNKIKIFNIIWQLVPTYCQHTLQAKLLLIPSAKVNKPLLWFLHFDINIWTNYHAPAVRHYFLKTFIGPSMNVNKYQLPGVHSTNQAKLNLNSRSWY